MERGYGAIMDPLSLGGHPLLADFQSAVFHPLNLVYLFLSDINGWTLRIILQPLLASFFMYLFLRHLQRSRLASLVAALAYAFSGYNLIYLEYDTHGHIIALIPLLLWLVDKWLLQSRAWALPLIA